MSSVDFKKRMFAKRGSAFFCASALVAPFFIEGDFQAGLFFLAISAFMIVTELVFDDSLFDMIRSGADIMRKSIILVVLNHIVVLGVFFLPVWCWVVLVPLSIYLAFEFYNLYSLHVK